MNNAVSVASFLSGPPRDRRMCILESIRVIIVWIPSVVKQSELVGVHVP